MFNRVQSGLFDRVCSIGFVDPEHYFGAKLMEFFKKQPYFRYNFPLPRCSLKSNDVAKSNREVFFCSATMHSQLRHKIRDHRGQ
jgi:hypothetical protein